MASAGNDRARQYQANLQGEVDSAALYRMLARRDSSGERAAIYKQLAETEDRHAAFWSGQLRAMGVTPGPVAVSWRSRVLSAIGACVGPQWILPRLITNERADSRKYDALVETRATPLPADERSHARALEMLKTSATSAGSAIARREGRHSGSGGNALRAAVLGANDGLVSNLSLVMGVAGAELQGSAILVTGLAGLLAGAASMALGEWLSVQSSRELYQRQIALESEELKRSPAEEQEELSLIYQAKGLSADQASALAATLMANRETALDTLVREELGIDPTELGGSAWQAAATSFVLFAIGAIVPVAPFVVLAGSTAVLSSVAASAMLLFAIGAAITLLTGRNALYSGARQVLFGLMAAALTYAVGRLIGVSIGG